MPNLDTLFQYVDANRQAFLDRLFDYLRRPSISAHGIGIAETADYLANILNGLGMKTQILPTEGWPLVFAERLDVPGAPTVLLYGHYDVQPPEPLEAWISPPFEPTIRDGRIYARGVGDNKGQHFAQILAVESLLACNQSLPCNIKILLEGEEEIGSPHLPKFIEENKELLQADVLVISDTGMIEKGKPSITYGLRGLTGLQIDIQGAKTDLHSGAYGGGVQNAAHALVQLLSTFHDEEGRIMVDGFYDNVLSITDEEKQAINALQLDDEKVRTELGVPELFGEPGYSFYERTSYRPTLEINGMYSGFQEEGIKTVLPNQASAKITCRLVPNQEPEQILELIKQHIEKHKPKGVTVKITPFDSGAPFVTPLNHPAIQAAGRAASKIYGTETAYIRSGGSIPIVADFAQILQVPIVLLGFSLDSENFHAPNEHFHLENFYKGMQTMCEYWNELAEIRFK